MNDADFSISPPTQLSPYPWAGIFLSLNSIPTTYTEEGICSAVFGEEARHISIERIRKGAVLDAVSALILKDRGVDVGLSASLSFSSGSVTELYSEDLDCCASVWKGSARLMNGEFKDDARVLLYANFDGEKIPLAFSYENKEGQRFLVYTFDAMAFPTYPNLLRGYLCQRILTDGIEWIAGEKLPAKCVKNPDLYIMCSREEDNGALAVALFNCYPDSILNPTVMLDREYSSVEFFGCEGRLVGDTVVLDRPLAAYEYCAFLVK
jgi:hypothetical protein